MSADLFESFVEALVKGLPIFVGVALTFSLRVHFDCLVHSLLRDANFKSSRSLRVSIKSVAEFIWVCFITPLLDLLSILKVASASTVVNQHMNFGLGVPVLFLWRPTAEHKAHFLSKFNF